MRAGIVCLILAREWIHAGSIPICHVLSVVDPRRIQLSVWAKLTSKAASSRSQTGGLKPFEKWQTKRVKPTVLLQCAACSLLSWLSLPSRCVKNIRVLANLCGVLLDHAAGFLCYLFWEVQKCLLTSLKFPQIFHVRLKKLEMGFQLWGFFSSFVWISRTRHTRASRAVSPGVSHDQTLHVRLLQPKTCGSASGQSWTWIYEFNRKVLAQQKALQKPFEIEDKFDYKEMFLWQTAPIAFFFHLNVMFFSV